MDEQNIPIDINTSKLLDWLISRRHVNKDWQKNVVKIREKINNAIQDMPAHDGIVKLLSGQHINYFHCLKIIEILKETEADTKNLFGRYGSQRMKDWQDIVSSYERDNIHLAEAAQILIRNVNFEIPSLHKQVARLEQSQTECEKKIKEYTKNETVASNEFTASCKQLGITGNNIKKELIQLLDELPKIYSETVEKIKTVQPAIQLYEAFNKFLTGKETEMVTLNMLCYLIKNENTTTYEYVYGEKPVTIETPALDIFEDDTEPTEGANEIDFGDSPSEEIDFSLVDISPANLDTTPVDQADIDWGTSSSTDNGFEIIDQVDFDINLEESGIVVENSGLDGGVARGNDALTVLDNPKTREMIINELLELEAFLKMRLFEMSNESDLLSMSQMQEASSILQMQSLETVTSMNDCVSLALNEFMNKRTQHLHNVKHSPKYVDMLTASLKQKLDAVERMKARKKLLEEKIRDAREEIKNILPVINTTVEKTKLLQKQVEEEISKKYKGRQVNIVGGVNML